MVVPVSVSKLIINRAIVVTIEIIVKRLGLVYLVNTFGASITWCIKMIEQASKSRWCNSILLAFIYRPLGLLLSHARHETSRALILEL